VFKFYRYLFPGLIALVLGFRLGAILLIRPAPVFDEPIHLQVAQQFGPGLPALSLLRDYPSAAGPFFYVLFGNLGAPLGYDLTLLRVAVFALAVGSLLLFYRVLRRLLPADNPLPAVALLATAPYFPALAGVFMTEHLALFLGLAALLWYLRFRGRGHPADAVLSLLFATLAIYTRSYFIFLPVAFAINDIVAGRYWSIFHRWPRRPQSDSATLTDSRLSPAAHPSSPSGADRPSPIPHHSSLLGAALWLLPIVAFLPMALLWRGLAPPSYQHKYHPGFEWQNASSLLIWTGLLFLPWVWRRLKPRHLVALFAVPVVLLAPLPGLGITRSALKLLPHPLAAMAACLLGIIGLLWYLQLAPSAIGRDTVSRENGGQSHEGSRRTLAGTVPVFAVVSHSLRVAAIGALLLVAGLLVSGPAVYERYLLPGVPLMLICARPGTRPGLALAWAVALLPLALGHILHLAA